MARSLAVVALGLEGHAGRQVLARHRGNRVVALHRLRRRGVLLRAARAVGDLEDLERRHDRRLLEEAAVRLRRAAHQRADALLADEDRVAKHVRGTGDGLRDDLVLADHETLPLYDWDAHSVPSVGSIEQKGPAPPGLLRCARPGYSIARMLEAWAPLGPCVISNDTRWFSFSDLKPFIWIAEKCANTSFPPSSGVMKPNPFASLNHFTVPVLIVSSLMCFIGSDREPGLEERQCGLRIQDGHYTFSDPSFQ